MGGRRIATIFAVGAGYVLLSSWFGLTTTLALDGNLLDAMVSFFVDVWADSLAADTVFVTGTLAAGLLAIWFYESVGWPASVAAATLGNWLTYVASYSLLGDVQHPEATTLSEAAPFVVEWGWPGLLVAAITPAVSLWLIEEGHLQLAFADDRPT